MARYAPEHKETTRRRMIDAAGRRFKSDGFDGTGISTLVADASLTNGAFYGHFASKNDLIASVVAQQLADQAARVEALPPGLASVEAVVRDYLSPAHRDDVAGGCPSAALLDEIGRRDDGTRQAYTEGVCRLIDAVARLLAPEDTGDEVAHARATGLVNLLVGSLQGARAVSDPGLSDRMLASAHTVAMTIVTAPLRPSSSQESS
ncbi:MULTISPECIES: TetR/AcrR family transcriptional regulator [Nocardioides]|uniref:TetR/AcrR family transcriptional regulator n=1 Tax=Nocardioides TaxID=1839 RepID=UPI00032DCC9C|nr:MULTISPECIES: TetR/AcrR family transcriptional regulator [Nocardioides]EON24564.1 TetR family regulator [Nocardioides sp. CF8]